MVIVSSFQLASWWLFFFFSVDVVGLYFIVTLGRVRKLLFPESTPNTVLVVVFRLAVNLLMAYAAYLVQKTEGWEKALWVTCAYVGIYLFLYAMFSFARFLPIVLLFHVAWTALSVWLQTLFHGINSAAGWLAIPCVFLNIVLCINLYFLMLRNSPSYTPPRTRLPEENYRNRNSHNYQNHRHQHSNVHRNDLSTPQGAIYRSYEEETIPMSV